MSSVPSPLQALLRLTALSVALIASGCGATESGHSIAPATREHGVRIGDSPLIDSVDCRTDSLGQALSLPAAPLLVSFASAADCALCESHLAVMDSLRVAGRLPFEYRVVFSATPERHASAARSLRIATATPLCYDVAERLWRTHGIARTPFTVLIVQSRVRYINDRFLTSPTERSALLTDLSAAADRVRSSGEGRAH
jgi:hypothetical protein